MSQENFELITRQLPSGSVLARAIAELSPEDLSRLKQQAADGMLALELKRLVDQHKFQLSSTEIEDFVQQVQRLQRAGTTYTATGHFKTASGETTITATSKKGCYIATAVYGSEEHPNVLILRQFRDSRLETNYMGRLFCSIYYFLSPRISRSRIFNRYLGSPVRSLLDLLCAVLFRKN